MRFFGIRRDKHVSLGWRKSSLSMGNSHCVEVAGLADDVIKVRDSKNPRGAVLSFTQAEWDAFVAGVYLGEFDRRRPD